MSVRVPRPLPAKLVLKNDAVVLSPVEVSADLAELYQAASLEANQVDLFRYHVNVPPMTDIGVFEEFLRRKQDHPTEVTYKVFSCRLGKAVGCVSLLNVRADHGVIEVGSIWYSVEAQRTEINTNALYLLFCYVFDVLGYRRLEWKCNAKNEASKKAAVRLGFGYEGLFRNHMVSRGENRDTAWYSIIDDDWKARKDALEEKL